MLTLDLPYPPSVNHMYINARGRRFPNKKAVDYKIKVQDIVIDQQARKFGSSPISLQIWVYPPDRRKRDISNIIKIVEDSLQDAGIYDDDFQINLLVVERGKILKGGKVTVIIDEIDEPRQEQR
jgi:crossover junction endodeoxyribonuclease RusA